MSCRSRLLDWATVAAGSRVEGLDDDHTPTAARTNIPLFVFVTTVRAIAVSAQREPGLVRRAADGPMQCCRRGWRWRGGHSVGCGGNRRAGRGSGSGG